MSFHSDTDLSEELVVIQLKALAQGDRLKTALYTELASGGTSVLELGCGTGSRSLEMSKISQVVAVDSSEHQLELARSRDTENAIEWINSNPVDFRLDRKFDVVVLGEYFFQSLLSHECQTSALATIAEHLDQDGRFILASRNPECGIEINTSRKSRPNMLNHTGMGLIEVWNESEFSEESSILTSTDGFNIMKLNQTICDKSVLRYTSKDEMCSLVQKAGLHPIKWLGDWAGNAWQTDSQDIILIGSLANSPFRM